MNLRSLPHLDLERLLVSESRIRYPFVWIQFPEIYQSPKNTAERESNFSYGKQEQEAVYVSKCKK